MLVKVTFNGTRLTDRFLVNELSRPLPEFRDATSEVDGMDGESFDGLTVGTRECSFNVSSVDKSKRSLQDDARMLMSVLAVRKPVPLLFSDELDKDGVQLVRYAVPTGRFDVDEYAVAGTWKCSFNMPDPFLYGKPRSVVLKANQPQRVDAGGNVEAWPVSVAKVTGGTYALSGGGKQVRFSSNGSRTLTLDHAAQTAKLSPSDANATGLLTGSRFFPLSGAMTLSANMQTTVSWTERWL